MPEIQGIRVPFVPAGGAAELQPNRLKSPGADKARFGDVFRQELDRLKFSAHAQSRIASRDINLSDGDLARLDNALSLANSKGAGETLVMLDEKAFIINVPNKTVITVVDRQNMESNIITDIDSAVFA